MSLSALKLALAVAALIAGGLGVMLAWMIAGGDTSEERFMTLGDTFAAGVLMGAGLVHLLSDGVGGFRSLTPGLNYPLAFVFAGAAFLLILLIEGVIAAKPNRNESLLHCGSSSANHEIGPQAATSEPHPYVVVLLLVLSVHSVIVGVTLGAQSSVSRTLIVFIAILAHKSVAGFALGVSYRRAGYSLRRTIPVAVFFSSMTPLGILAGTTIFAIVGPHAGQLFEAVFDSMGAGTFLYIAILDIIRTEFELPGDRWQKWLLASLGFGLMAMLALWV